VAAPSAVTEADDRLHPVTTDDRSWTETMWFAAAVPERGIGIWTYPLFRPELRIMSCGIYVWAPGAEELWQLPYFRHWWHLPLDPGLDLRRFTLSNGLSYECLEPLRAYRIAYADEGELELELEFRALHLPHGVGVEPGRHGHFDQLGRVTGELVLHGERIPVDCLEMRDRTWSPRRESRSGAFVTYSYGTTADGDGFHVSTRRDRKTGRQVLLTGYLLRDGTTVPLADATCEVRRDDAGRPVGARVTGTGPDGATLTVEGEVVSRLAQPSTPWFVWACLVRWTLPGGVEAFGEHQDTWAPRALRAARGAGTAAAAP